MYRESACVDVETCPACVATEIPSLAATCAAGRCTELDLSQELLTGCVTDNDCVIRAARCCECDAPREYVALASTALSVFESRICEPDQACSECTPDTSGVAPVCLDGHCWVRLASSEPPL
jgi:hypothetical protein